MIVWKQYFKFRIFQFKRANSIRYVMCYDSFGNAGEKQTHKQTSRETQMMSIRNHSCLCSGKNLWLKFQWNFKCNFMLFEISNKPIIEVWKLCETLWNFVKFYHWNFKKFHWNFMLFQIVWNFQTLGVGGIWCDRTVYLLINILKICHQDSYGF